MSVFSTSIGDVSEFDTFQVANNFLESCKEEENEFFCFQDN